MHVKSQVVGRGGDTIGRMKSKYEGPEMGILGMFVNRSELSERV